MTMSLDHLRRYAVARSLFAPTTLGRAITKLGFVQADPIRAPARAQDLILRHRVRGYQAGDLERRYARLAVEEDFLVNYGFLPRATSDLMHPRTARRPWTAQRRRQARALLAFIRERGCAHPREVDARFAHGKVTNWFGGASNATTQLLDEMHYRGLLRVVRRDGGTRVYGVREPAQPPVMDALTADERMDALVDVIVAKYAPLPAGGLGRLLSLLCHGVPQWRLRRGAALARAKRRLAHGSVGAETWYWPASENPRSARWRPDEAVRLLAPFDPIAFDRRRFEMFWGWSYRFEAYTPAPKRQRGYYALPLLWGNRVIGWGNVAVSGAALVTAFGYATGREPKSALFRRELALELDRLREFLRLDCYADHVPAGSLVTGVMSPCGAGTP
jgi:uncharacterized protein YcaQ